MLVGLHYCMMGSQAELARCSRSVQDGGKHGSFMYQKSDCKFYSTMRPGKAANKQ